MTMASPEKSDAIFCSLYDIMILRNGCQRLEMKQDIFIADMGKLVVIESGKQR